MAATTPVVLLAITSGVFWGIGPIFSKLGMQRGGSSRQATLIVLLVGAGLFWSVLFVRSGGGRLFTAIAPEIIILFAAAGVLGTSFAWLLWFRGIDRVGASASNVAFYTQPLYAAILAAIFLGERLTLAIAGGVVLIVSGVGLLSVSGGDSADSWSVTALAFPLGAAILAAVSNVIKRFGFRNSPIDALEAAAINLTSALPLLLAYVLLVRSRSLLEFDHSDLCFLGTGLSNAVAVLAMFAALERGPVIVVSPLVGTSPLFTTVLAYFLLDDIEQVTLRTFISAGLTVTGAAIISLA